MYDLLTSIITTIYLVTQGNGLMMKAVVAISSINIHVMRTHTISIRLTVPVCQLCTWWALVLKKIVQRFGFACVPANTKIYLLFPS